MSNTAASAKTTKKNKTIYLDHAATTPTDERILLKMLPYFAKEYGNSSSMHSSGRRAKQVIVRARQDIANIIGALPDEIIFTSSGTESDNLSLMGVARAYKKVGDHI